LRDTEAGHIGVVGTLTADRDKARQQRDDYRAALERIDQRGPISRPNGPLGFMHDRELGHALAWWDAAEIAREALGGGK
jgi:hypothetical protein